MPHATVLLLKSAARPGWSIRDRVYTPDTPKKEQTVQLTHSVTAERLELRSWIEYIERLGQISARGSHLRPFHITELLDPPMIVLYRPSIVGVFDARQFAHLQVIARPVFYVAVCGNDLEYSNQPLA
jgi:hypothetical protein